MGPHITKALFTSDTRNLLHKSEDFSQEVISSDNEVPSTPPSIIAKRMETSSNTVQDRMAQLAKRINGKRSSNSQGVGTSKKSKIDSPPSSSDIIRSYRDFTALNVHLFSTILKMNGGSDQQDQASHVPCGSFTRTITRSRSTNGGMVTPTKKP